MTAIAIVMTSLKMARSTMTLMMEGSAKQLAMIVPEGLIVMLMVKNKKVRRRKILSPREMINPRKKVGQKECVAPRELQSHPCSTIHQLEACTYTLLG